MATFPPRIGSGSEPYRAGYGPVIRDAHSVLDDWSENRLAATAAKLRAPIVLGNERIMLAASRCEQLSKQAEALRDRYLNLPGWSDPSVAQSLEERVARIQSELHGERLALWGDLRSLMEKVSDAGVERLRTVWLQEIANLLERPSSRSDVPVKSYSGGGLY
jgi:hypothetical protein